jgi:hypothetical protein
MTRKRRAVLGIGLVEVMLAGLWVYLEMLGGSHPDRISPQFHQVVGQTMGGAMGFIAAIGVVAYLAAAKHERKASPPKG